MYIDILIYMSLISYNKDCVTTHLYYTKFDSYKLKRQCARIKYAVPR